MKPGAPFFATSLRIGAMGTDSLPKAVRDRGYRFFTTEELEELFKSAGFVDVVVRKEAPALLDLVHDVVSAGVKDATPDADDGGFGFFGAIAEMIEAENAR